MAVLSGGNIDPLLLQRVVSHGLAASGRYLTIRIPLPTVQVSWPASPSSSPRPART